MRAVALYGTVGSLLLTGLTALTSAPAAHGTGAPYAPPAPQAPSTPSVADSPVEARGVVLAAERAAAKGITFGACPAAEGLPAPVECGTFSVPVDYARPNGKHISLTVSRGRATGDRSDRQGSLVYNPGGPGGSGMVFPLLAGLPAWKKLSEAYDFIGYAPRGVGRSAPLTCADPARFERGPSDAPEHPSAAYKRQRIAKAKAYARGCLRHAGADLRHFTSRNNARDLDVLRAALGERKLNFLGASYGTYFGAVYATLFPGHVRRMVFDSVVNPSTRKIWYRNNLDQSAAFERRWYDWRRWAARHHPVYRLGRTEREVLAAYHKAAERLRHRPAGGKVGPGELQGLFLKAGYTDTAWARAAQALAAYLRGDESRLIALAAPSASGGPAAENGNAVYTAVECNDAHWPRDWSRWNRDNERLARRAPFETWNNAFMNLPCAYWKAPRQRPFEVGTARRALPPVLLLAAERDAATPYAGALELLRRLRGSATLVTERDAGTHGIGGGPNACVNGYFEKYLLTGEVPTRNVTCAGRQEPRAT
ncbi:alpha/beta hydrolase [Streptomyces huiliensis]|uniref:alpha/beta hydrolase n=1 Tax=Streptomyces huiliensis TaxID=2876027 RepID=UPI001CBD8A36|nr:alpha/beta hydrolase [Streptomyces huiliensis]MBZ4317877.1 alpha/beta hydrolase [Streptomyces huiliensis]